MRHSRYKLLELADMKDRFRFFATHSVFSSLDDDATLYLVVKREVSNLRVAFREMNSLFIQNGHLAVM
jgi:hypothetical protein